MLMHEVCELYVEDKSQRLRGNTMEGYVSALRKHILPAWGDRELASIGHEELQHWVDAIPTYGAAAKAFKTIRQVIRWAIRKLQLRIWDVTVGIELPQAPVRERPEALTPKQEAEMLRGVWGQPWEAVVVLAAALGLRRSEACGVDWSDIDWRSGWVHIQRGAHWVCGEVVEYATKTELSDRWLKLPRWALARLRAIRGARRRGRVRGDMAPHQIAGFFRRYCKRFCLAWVPLGHLRHSWATIAISAGAALEDVAVALGHSSVETCRRHYLRTERVVALRACDAYAGAVAEAMPMAA